MDDGVIGAVVLAAGRSSRMGRAKLLLPLSDGRPMVEHVVARLLQGGAAPVVVVVGAEAGVAEAAESTGARIVRASAESAEDMLTSLQQGLQALVDSPVEAALVQPGDMPFVQPSTVRSILDLWILERSLIVAPSHERKRGHPVCLAREAWEGIMALRPPSSLRDYLRQHAGEVRYLVVDDPGVVEDVDWPEDYHQAVGRPPRG